MNGFSNFKFNPMSFQPALWIDAARHRGTNGDSLASILDLSGNGNHLSQSSSSLRPTFATNVINGYPAFVFDASDDGMATSLTLGSQWAFFVVEYVTTNGGNRRTIQSTTLNALVSLSRNDAAPFWANGQVSTVNATATKVAVGCLKTGPTNCEAWLNGTNRTNGTTANITWGGVGFGTVGAAGVEPGATSVMEVIIFDRFITDNERATMNAYLIGKYAAIEGAQ